MPGRFASVWPPSMAVALGHRADQSPPLPWTKAPWHHTAKHSYPARRPVCAPRIRGAASRPGTLTAAHRLAAGHRCSGETGARCGRAALGSGAMTSWAGPADRASRLRGQQRGSAASILRITVDVPCVVCACTASTPRRRGWTGRRLTWAWPRAGAAGSCPLPWALGVHKRPVVRQSADCRAQRRGRVHNPVASFPAMASGFCKRRTRAAGTRPASRKGKSGRPGCRRPPPVGRPHTRVEVIQLGLA